MDTIILIGGLVIFYSVIVEILFNMEFLNNIIYHLSNLLSIDIQLIKGIIIGFFEVTIGCKNIAASQSSLITKILILNFTIGWSGFSVHSQALSFINNTDINTKLYIVSKFLHGILSVLFGYALYLLKYQNYIQPTTYYPMYYNNQFNLSNWIYLLTSSTKLALIMIIYIFLLSMLVSTTFKTLKGSN